MEWITKDTTALDIANHYGNSVSDTAKAFEYWAKIKHKKGRHDAIDIVEHYAVSSEIDLSGVIRDIMNIRF
jgi:hypothetical protein